MSKEPRAERAMDLWAVRRAKKIWSRPLSLDNSLTLQPTLDSYVYHANSLERCVVAADYQRQGYSEPLNMWLTSTALVAWANGHTAGRAPQVWAEIAGRVLSDAGQTAFFGNFRKLKEALGPTKHRVYVDAFVSHYRYVKTDALKLAASQELKAWHVPARHITDAEGVQTQVCAYRRCSEQVAPRQQCNNQPSTK